MPIVLLMNQRGGLKATNSGILIATLGFSFVSHNSRDK